MLVAELLGWGCIPELAKDCQDMTNTSSTYFSIVVGALIGAVISCWIYWRQTMLAKAQDWTIRRIAALDERHNELLKRIEEIERHHQRNLEVLLEISKNMERFLEAYRDK
ncbi:MAG: hypothetical protein ABI361_01825 [Nitrososphaera sp.]|jgi:hypothetical protein